MNSAPTDIAVVGGGVIGLAVAWRLARDGYAVTVLDAAPEAREASWAAAGMLAPHNEAIAADDLWALGVDSLARWPAFAAELGGAEAVDLREDGGLVPSLGPGDDHALAERLAFLTRAGVPARRLDRAALAAAEPSLAPCVGSALAVPGGRVDPRRLARALVAACERAGVLLRYRTRVERIAPGVIDLSGAAPLRCDQTVLASGAWTPELARVSGIELSGEPVKGQLARLEAPDGLLRRFIHSHHAYLVPRAGAGVVVGSTMVSAGFDKSEDPHAVADLVARARALVPALARAEVVETWTGLRPRLHGGRPLICRARSGVVVATGHFRNGILLAPVTAEAVSALIRGGSGPASAAPFATFPPGIPGNPGIPVIPTTIPTKVEGPPQ